MKKPTSPKRLKLETQVVRALDDASLTKAQGGASGQVACTHVNALCTNCCLIMHI